MSTDEEAHTGAASVERLNLVDMTWFFQCPLLDATTRAPHPRHLYRLHYEDGRVAFQHDCVTLDLPDGPVQKVVAPRLQLAEGGHRITLGSATSTDNALTVEPSVLCPDCGLHGYIRSGWWVDA